jgi:hypothetical protein
MAHIEIWEAGLVAGVILGKYKLLVAYEVEGVRFESS